MPTPNPTAGGGSSYAGFEYQFLASVWMALKLIFDRQLCSEVTIEPPSHEDVEAKLAETDDPEQTTSSLVVPLPAFPVSIQIKKRNAAWTKSKFCTVLNGEATSPAGRGPKPRQRPLDALQAKPDLRFILFTNAQVSTDLNDFVVSDIGAMSAAKELPIEPARADAADIAPRIGILPEHTPKALILEIEQLLRQHGHVPEAKTSECRGHLLDAVRLRVLGKISPSWSRTEIQKVFIASGGRLDDTVGIVVPAIFASLERQLAERHRLLLTGEPGIGKTELAHELARRLQVSPEAFEIVTGKAGIQAIRKLLNSPGSHLFFIEDPWGHDRLTDEAGSWASELPKLFTKAGPTKRFLVTSRVGVRHEAFGSTPIPGFTETEVELRPEHFPPADRREIMRLRMLEAKPWQRDWVNRHQSEWLKCLDRPLTIGHFASRVIQASKEEELKIEEVLRISDVEALAGIFASEIQRRGTAAVAAALLIWSVHRADDQISMETVRQARVKSRAGGFTGEFDPEHLLESFRMAGWFRSTTGRLVAHPTALTGIESLLKTHGGTADDVLGGFLTGLVASGETARAFAILRRLELRPSAASRNVREAVEKKLLDDYLAAQGYDANQAFRHLVDYSIDHSITSAPAIVLLHALRPTSGPGPMASMEFWRAPKLTLDEQNRIRGSAEAHAAARKFVLDVFPNDTWFVYSASDLVPFLQSFGWNFEPEFTAAALQELRNDSRNTHLESLVEAAVLSGTKEFSALTDGVLAASDSANSEWAAHASDRTRADQAELDGDQASYLDEEATELFSPVQRVTELIIGARRRAEGWQWLLTHPRVSELRWAWSAVIDASATREEIEALASLSADNPPLVWQARANTGDPAQLAVILAEASQVSVVHIDSWCKATARLANDNDWKNKVMPSLEQIPLSHRIVLAGMRNPDGDEGGEKFKGLSSLLSPQEHEVRDICEKLSEDTSWTGKVGSVHRTLLRELAVRGNETFRRVAVVALVTIGEDVTALATEMASSGDSETRRAALWARVYAGREDALKVILPALQDPDYRVRRQAIEMGIVKPAPEFLALLPEIANDKSAPVRETCANVLGRWADPLGLPVLVRLLRDRRDRRNTTFINRTWPEFHVARAAAQSLAKITLDAPTIEACLAFLSAPGTDHKTDDINVHYHVMDALKSADDDRLIPFFSAALESNWHVAGQDSSGYPLRRIAAISLMNQLARHPDRVGQVDLERLVIAATHDDPLLAGPAIVALGLCGAAATAKAIEVSRAKATTPDRAILLEVALAFRDDTEAARAELQKMSGKTHAARWLLDLREDERLAVSEWPAWRDHHPEFKDWLAKIRETEDVHGWIRFLLGMRFNGAVPEEFASDDRLEGLLPKPIGVLSLRGMFGGE